MELGQWIRDEMERSRKEAIDAMSVERLRELWDTLPDDGSAHIIGNLIIDCEDIHAALNRKGDGKYCAV